MCMSDPNMMEMQERLRRFINNRWLVFVASMWILAGGGAAYLFGSISPLVKSSMGYNQKQVSYLGVAKNLGSCVGFIAGFLSEILPFWGILAIGALQDFVGYGLLWLMVTHRLPHSPLWALCIAIFVGTNAETYYGTAVLVSGLQNFPESRGPIVGILKGFSGLSGAIVSQFYHLFSASIQDSLILMIAIFPPTIVISLMFVIRSVEGHQQRRPSDGLSFSFVYGVCLSLAAYLMGYLLLDDLTELSHSLVIFSSVILLIMLLLPLIIPVILTFFSEVQTPLEERLLPKISEAPELEKYDQLRTEPIHTVTEEAVAAKTSRNPRHGEDFTFVQAVVQADFWLIFLSLVFTSGPGVTIIDNIGQICQSLQLSDARIFVSIISICNFLGRVGGGYFSEIVVRNFALPRPVSIAVVQLIMAVGFLYYALEWPAAVYILTLVSGLGYGALWAIALATISELFGLKSFGAFFNFFTLAMPIGSFIFSTGIASTIYDYYAEKQMKQVILDHVLEIQVKDEGSLTCMGTICYSITCAILSGVLLIASLLTLVVVQRTRRFYSYRCTMSQH